MKPLTAALFILLFLLPEAWGDDSQPFYIEITEQAPARYQLLWRLPATFKPDNIPRIAMPDVCEAITNVGSAYPGAKLQQRLHCSEPLAGQTIDIHFPLYPPATSTLIKYAALNGEQHTRLLSPGEGQWQIPEAETPSRIAQDYTLLGMQHIWAGTDHLLFLLCLLWIAGSWRRVLITITGFTLAHSLTLALSALEWVWLPMPPVEAVIALSIVFLAIEIVKDNKQTLTWRYPIAVSSSFGLLHGFGFAAALDEIGLPQTELVTGLLFFNVGVEIGQVIFAAGVLMMIGLCTHYLPAYINQTVWQNRARYSVAYLIGGLASFWLIERSTVFVG